MSEPKTETVSLELNERELAILLVSLEIREMYHSPHNRNDLAALKRLIKFIEDKRKRATEKTSTLKIEKAIELLYTAKEGFPTGPAEDYYKAMKLGIEALRRIQGLRLYGLVPAGCKLWGETED